MNSLERLRCTRCIPADWHFRYSARPDLDVNPMNKLGALLLLTLPCTGCTLVSIAGTAVTTTASVAATVLETGVSVAGSAVKGVASAVTPSPDKN